MREITIAGKKYPVRLTMGAIREFKNQTGKDLESVTSISDMGEFLFACVVSASRLQGKKFTLTVEQFTDDLDIPQALEVFTGAMEESGLTSVNVGDKKKAE